MLGGRCSNSTMQEPEALSWLLNNKNETALATNRFGRTANAVKAVRRLYAAGATRVEVDVMYDELWRIEEGGPYADGIDVTVPKEKSKEILAVIRSLRPSGWHEDDYDSYEREIEADPAPSQTIHLWWE